MTEHHKHKTATLSRHKGGDSVVIEVETDEVARRSHLSHPKDGDKGYLGAVEDPTYNYSSYQLTAGTSLPGSETSFAGIAQWCFNTTIDLMALPFTLLSKLLGGR